MCGIAAIVERDPTRVTPDDDLAGMVQALLHRGPDEDGRVVSARRRARHAAAGDCRSGHRAAADSRTRPARSTSSPTARSTTSSSCATSSKRRATASRRASSDIECCCTPRKSGARRSRRGCAGCSRPSIWDAPHPDAVRRARSRRREAAVLDLDRARPAAGLGGQGAADASRGLAHARPRVARPVPDLRIRDRAAHDAPGHPRAAGRLVAALPRRRRHRAALLGSGGRRGARLERRRGRRRRDARRCSAPSPAS